MLPDKFDMDYIINAYRTNSRTCPITLHPDLAVSLLYALYDYRKTVSRADKELNNKIKQILDEFLKTHPDVKME